MRGDERLRAHEKAWLRPAASPAGRRAGSLGISQSPVPSPLILQPGAPSLTLVVTVMGAQHLPKRGVASGESTQSRVPSPYCSVIVYGDPVDTIKHKTKPVVDNGFNPVWSEQFRFTMSRPEVAVLYIAVHDQVDLARTSFLAFFAVPVSAIRAGYRSCPLRSPQGKKYPFCSLLCRFQRR